MCIIELLSSTKKNDIVLVEMNREGWWGPYTLQVDCSMLSLIYAQA